MIKLQAFFSTIWKQSSQENINNNISTGNKNSANQDGNIIYAQIHLIIQNFMKKSLMNLKEIVLNVIRKLTYFSHNIPKKSYRYISN